MIKGGELNRSFLGILELTGILLHRRRLHGAFTGGFSAGYYNTVGSKEGKFAICFEDFSRKQLT